MADRALIGLLGLVLVVGLTAGQPAISAEQGVRLDSYAEWKRGSDLVVDGQRVRATPKTKWKGTHGSIGDVPLGEEVRVQGLRQPDGVVLASEIDVRPNGPNALFEAEVRNGTNQLEAAWTEKKLAFEPGASGKIKKIGEVADEGPDVDRVRGLVNKLAPPYVSRDELRVYVIDSKEWNAMAMGNGAIWVFSGIMHDMPDDQLAIVVGHELAHYTHEHSRRQARRAIWTQLAGVAAIIGAEAIDSNAARAGAQLPAVWQRFLDKYGQEDRVTNFFFSDHSRASARQRNLERELANNYR